MHPSITIFLTLTLTLTLFLLPLAHSQPQIPIKPVQSFLPELPKQYSITYERLLPTSDGTKMKEMVGDPFVAILGEEKGVGDLGGKGKGSGGGKELKVEQAVQKETVDINKGEESKLVVNKK